MVDSSLVVILANAGVAGVGLVLFILGLIVPRSVLEDRKAEIKELKAALAAERQRADSAVAAAATTRDILLALRRESRPDEAA
jgi:hypothetical protein